MDRVKLSRQRFHIPTLKLWWLAAFIAIWLFAIWGLIALIPWLHAKQVPPGVSDPAELGRLENAFVTTLAQIAGGIVLIIGVFFTWLRVRAAEREVKAAEQQVEVAREQQITERFTRAVEQLGSDNTAIVLGGIYALERIARDSQKDHRQVMEVLTAYVREKAPWPPKPGSNQSRPDEELPEGYRPPITIQAIITVLGRRRIEYEHYRNKEDVLELCNTDMRRIKFSANAHFENTVFDNSSFRSAILLSSNFQNSFLCNCDFKHAYLGDADFKNAWFEGALLAESRGLSRHQLQQVKRLNNATLPDEFKDMIPPPQAGSP